MMIDGTCTIPLTHGATGRMNMERKKQRCNRKSPISALKHRWGTLPPNPQMNVARWSDIVPAKRLPNLYHRHKQAPPAFPKGRSDVRI